MKWGPAVAALAAVGCVATPAAAFWEFEADAVYADARAFVASSVVSAGNPDEPLLYPHPHDTASQVEVRLLTDLSVGEWLRVESNVAYLGTSTTAAGPQLFVPQAAGRSSALRWHESDDPASDHLLEVDWLSLRTTVAADSAHPVDLRVGRFAINLATTFYFTPNDFFSPFSADTFFRSYKPGVDAARLDVQLGDLTQLTVLGVAGYGDGKAPEWKQTSALTRLSTSVADLEVAVLGGVIPDRFVAGASVQGEVLEWLGVRGEGHYAWGRGDTEDRLELVAGIDRRFESTLTLRAEQLYHGAGYSRPGRYLDVVAHPERPGLYLGRHYTAVGAGYEVTPLLVTEGFTLVNWTDRSSLTGLNLVYSLADDAQLSVVGTLPWGQTPSLPASVGSEFGLYPRTFGIDFRAWF